ncbi:hypothetical protein HID58_075525, partial [Brassica napus]
MDPTSIQRIVDCMRSTRQINVIFEPSFFRARESWMTNTRAILQFLNDLEAWNFSHVNTSKNMHAIRIEESATKDNRTQSYIAYGYS